MTTEITKKKKKIRHNEYYDTQEMFDDLYEKSQKGYKFNNLLDVIKDPRNIELAYRNIKKNKGSKTKGANKSTIIDLSLIHI